MAVSRLIPYKDDLYYVDEEGKMAVNRWVSIENTGYTGDYKDGQPKQWWYYFQPNGKALRGPKSGNVAPKNVGDKKYAFDSQGRMLSGWIQSDDASLMLGDEEAWRKADYYFGGEDDGAMALGWMQIGMLGEWSQDQKVYARGKGAGGRRYVATLSQAWRNYRTVDDGRRYTNGWFKVVPAENLNPDNHEELEEGWYYADGRGHIYAGEFKYINGKRYGFDTEGRMLHGFQMVQAKGTRILDSIEPDELPYLEFNHEEMFDYNAAMFQESGYSLYYFGEEEDGSMRTGAQPLKFNEDDKQTCRFKFKESGRGKGSGITGIENGHVYNMGKLFQADPYQKYQVLALANNENLIASFGTYDVLLPYELEKGVATVITRSGEYYRAVPLSEEDLDQPDSMGFQHNGNDTGITMGEIKKALGIQSRWDRCSEVVVFITEKRANLTAPIEGYSIGLPSDVFLVIDRNGKVIEKNARVKDGDGVFYKLYRGRLTGIYVEE